MRLSRQTECRPSDTQQVGHSLEVAGQRENAIDTDVASFHQAGESVRCVAEVVVRLFVKLSDERDRDQDSATRAQHPTEFIQRVRRGSKMFEDLGANNSVDAARLEGKLAKIGDDVGVGGPGVRRRRPVLGPVEAVREERPVRRISCPSVENHRPARERSSELSDLPADGQPVDRRLGDEPLHHGIATGRESHGGHTRVGPVNNGLGSLRVAVLSGVPGLLGGGGLEIQAERTVKALCARGTDARVASRADPEWSFDILHVFGNTADVGHILGHWRRCPARLVASPVIVVPPSRERRFKLATRLPIPAFEPRVLAALAVRADHLVALTRWEQDTLLAIGRGQTAPVSVIGNGVDVPDGTAPVRTLAGRELPKDFVVTVGAVSPRKRQPQIAAGLREVMPYVVIGGWDGPPDGRDEFEATVAATGGIWLGEVTDRRTVLGIIAAARAMVHLSEAEGQSLAVLEALAVGTHCVLSDLPQQRELATDWPAHVSIVQADGDLAATVRAVPERSGVRAEIPTWDDVAAGLEGVYRDAMQKPARLWNARG